MPVGAGETGVQMWTSLLQFLLATGAVIAAAAWATRRLGRWLQPGRPAGIEVRSYVPLGGRRALCLVRLDDQELLLGVTDHEVRLLLRRSAPADPSAPTDREGDRP